MVEQRHEMREFYLQLKRNEIVRLYKLVITDKLHLPDEIRNRFKKAVGSNAGLKDVIRRNLYPPGCFSFPALFPRAF